MYSAIDCYPNAIVFHKLTNGIHGDFKSQHNGELINFLGQELKNEVIDLPQGFAKAICSRQMLRNDFKKFLKTYPWAPDPIALENAMKILELTFLSRLSSSTISFQRAIEVIDKTKSPGYPFNSWFKSKQEVIDCPEAMVALQTTVDNLRLTGNYLLEFRGKRFYHPYWQASPKNEFRPIDKLSNDVCEKRKTRVFMAGDFVTHIVMVMLYYDQNENLRDSWLDTWSMYGVSLFYGGWNHMCQYLNSSYQIRDIQYTFTYGDFAHFEASVKEQIQTFIYQMRNNNVCSDMPRTHLDNLQKFVFSSVVYSYVIDPDGWLIMKFGCNPSGSFNTLSDNKFANILVHLYSFCLYNNGKSFEELYRLSRLHHLAIMGDDSVVPKHPHFSNVSRDARDLGFNLTEEMPPGPLFSGKFLNCGFKVNKLGYWYPVPNWDKIRSGIYYAFESHSWRLAYVKVCAYRTLAYLDEYHFQEAERLLDYILKNHKYELEFGEAAMDSKLTYLSCLSSKVSLDQLDFMWTGSEVGPSTLK